MRVHVDFTMSCPFKVEPDTLCEQGDTGMVCNQLPLPEGGRARCNCKYPPKYCPLKTDDIIVSLRKAKP